MVWHTGRDSGSEGYGNQKNDQSGDRSTSESEGICITNTPPHQCVRTRTVATNGMLH